LLSASKVPSANSNTIDKVESSSTGDTATVTTYPPAQQKVRPIEIQPDEQIVEGRIAWVKKGSITLYGEHKEMILDGSKLNDLVINAAQAMLKEQFPDLLGLQSTLLLKKQQPSFQNGKAYVQIIFDREDHLLKQF